MFFSGLSSLTVGKPIDSNFLGGSWGDSSIIPLSFRLEVKDRLEPKFDDRLFLYFMRLLISFAWSYRCFSSKTLNYLI